MHAIVSALADPLSPEERRIFDQMHLTQPHFGGLPLILLDQRLDFVKSVIWEIVDKPGGAGLTHHNRMIGRFGKA
jgi:hypothetical protein